MAAGCEDGTVGVWDTDHLPLISPSLPSQGPGLDLAPRKGERTCLFCHQLRPTERLVIDDWFLFQMTGKLIMSNHVFFPSSRRPVVCLEWLRMQGGSPPLSSFGGAHEDGMDKPIRTTSNVTVPGSGSTGSCVMLVTGARDGSIHIVDVNRGGTVLAVFDCGTLASTSTDQGDVPSSSDSNNNSKTPYLMSMAVSDVLTAPIDLALVPSTATASIFAGFSDGTVHVLGVHIGLDTTDCDHYEGVWKLAYVRLESVCVLVASASGLSLLPIAPSSSPSFVHNGIHVKKMLPGITSLCWTQTPSMIDQPTVVSAAATMAFLDQAGKAVVLTRNLNDGDDGDEAVVEKTNVSHTTYREDINPIEITHSCQGTLISGHADGTVKSWQVTVFHRIESNQTNN